MSVLENFIIISLKFLLKIVDKKKILGFLIMYFHIKYKNSIFSKRKNIKL